MIRIVLALLLLAAAIAAGAFFAGNPGHVAIVWQGWRLDTSVGVLVAGIVLVALAVALLALFVAALRRLPRNVRRRWAVRRQRAGERALTRGFVALAAGEAGEAQRQAARATALLPGSVTALLLTAEAAQRQGDAGAARQAYLALRQQRDSEFLGLRGLIAQALRTGDDAAARPLAERARQLRPGARWLVESLVLLQARAGDWAAVDATLQRAARRGALLATDARRRRGVALHELSRVAQHANEMRRAAALAAKAQGLAPDVAEVAVHHARLLLALGRRRAATKALERAWRAAPHPAVAQCYGELAGEAGSPARAAALQRLAAQNPEALESRLAAAEAALDARLWGEARRQLDSALATAGAEPPRRLCLALARLEEDGANDAAAARRWLDRALLAPSELTYVCRHCGGATPQWQALCPNCGEFATLAWAPATAGRGSESVLAAPGAALMLPATDVAPAAGGAAPGLAPAARSDN